MTHTGCPILPVRNRAPENFTIEVLYPDGSGSIVGMTDYIEARHQYHVMQAMTLDRPQVRVTFAIGPDYKAVPFSWRPLGPYQEQTRPLLPDSYQRNYT